MEFNGERMLLFSMSLTVSLVTALILQVREDVFKEHQELQVHVQYAKIPTKCYKPIHLQLAHQQQLKRQFVHSKSTLQKLGNFGSLINHMTLQSLATIISQDVVSFLKCVLEVTHAFNL